MSNPKKIKINILCQLSQLMLMESPNQNIGREIHNEKRNPYLSIVIPAYNEEERIESVLENYYNSMNSLYPKKIEIIVVCNGCNDQTPEIVKELAKKHPEIKFLNYKKKIGKGGAITQGFKKAKGELIGFLDADDSTEAREYIKLIEILENTKVDGVISSRKIKGALILVKQPLKRRITSRIFNILIRLMYGLDFKDTQCGAKLFKKDVIKNILKMMKSTGFEFDVELLWRIKNKGFTVTEVPITWKHREGSTFSLIYAPTMFINLIRIRLFT